MSTISTVTDLVACDHTLGNDSKLPNHMCVLGDGTPFHVTSIQEEDLAELCVEVEQAHPKGVLWSSAMESVTVFQSSKEMLAMACMDTKAMAWQEEPIRLCTSPPSTAHLRAYIAGRNACSLGTQCLTPEGEGVPRSPLETPNLMGGPHANSAWPLGIPKYGSWWKTSGRW